MAWYSRASLLGSSAAYHAMSSVFLAPDAEAIDIGG